MHTLRKTSPGLGQSDLCCGPSAHTTALRQQPQKHAHTRKITKRLLVALFASALPMPMRCQSSSVALTLEEPLWRLPVLAVVVEETAGLKSTDTASSWAGASGPSSQVLMRPPHPPDPSSGLMDLQKVLRIWSAAMPPRQQVAGANTSMRRTCNQTSWLRMLHRSQAMELGQLGRRLLQGDD